MRGRSENDVPRPERKFTIDGVSNISGQKLRGGKSELTTGHSQSGSRTWLTVKLACFTQGGGKGRKPPNPQKNQV